MFEINIMRCQGPAQPPAKRIFEKFQLQPELGHEVPQDQGDGDGLHVQGRGGRVQRAIGLIFLDNHLTMYM